MIVFIDSGVLGLLAKPDKDGEVIQCKNWLYYVLSKGVYVVSSDICDYEIRRSLILEAERKKLIPNINTLDNLRNIIDFLPITYEVTCQAAQIWAKARLQGQPTASDKTIDVDMIIAAHWLRLKDQFPSRYIVIATTNVKHLSLFAEALTWENIKF